jgi:hypothetical protein
MEALRARLEDLREQVHAINDENDAYWGEKIHSAPARTSYRQRIEQLAWLRKEITQMQGRLTTSQLFIPS